MEEIDFPDLVIGYCGVKSQVGLGNYGRSIEIGELFGSGCHSIGFFDLVEDS